MEFPEVNVQNLAPCANMSSQMLSAVSNSSANNVVQLSVQDFNQSLFEFLHVSINLVILR